MEAAPTVQKVLTFEDFRDYKHSNHTVTIARAQQLALSKAAAPVPIPSKQLELASNKKDKEPRAYHV